MKKIAMLFIAGLLALSGFMMFSNLESRASSGISVYIDGERITMDAAPFIENGRTLVPIRGVFEKLGATVDWNKQTQQVIIKNDAVEVLMDRNNKAVLLNGQVRYLDAATQLFQDRTYVPIRFVAESLGYKVTWDSAQRRVDIMTTTAPMQRQESLPVVGSLQTLVQLLNYSSQLGGYVNGRTDIVLEATDDAIDVQPQVTDVAEESKSDEVAVAPSAEQMPVEAGADDYSGTNNQVSGVEEGDIVKTDGVNIYTVSNNTVYIISADPDKPQMLSQITVDSAKGYVSDLYVQDGKLVLIGNQYSYYYYDYPMPIVEAPAPISEDGTQVVADAMMIAPPSYSSQSTFVLVYDMVDVRKPALDQDYSFEGYYVTSRMIGNQFYMVTQKDFNSWIYTPYLDSSITVLDDEQEAQAKPRYANNLTDEVIVFDYKDIRYFPDEIQPTYMLTIGLDLSKESLDVQAYLGRAETVYASQENMYLALTKYAYVMTKNSDLYLPTYEKSTSLYKFALNDATVAYAGKGSVPGAILNQFSMDEYGSNLRVATTTGETWDAANPSENNLYVLDADMDQIGKLTGLAEGEKIYSTRFSGERIYMVTYRQVDPFFVIDASDPKDPKMLGYLKIPGFSTYMHVLDEDHILGFGYDSREQDGLVTRGGFKISLFDVTDPQNPVESDKEVIGTTGTSSELEYNHKALMISLNKGLMAFPITVASATPYVTDFSGAYVYDLSTDAFSYRGMITHQNNSTMRDDYGYKYFDYDYNISRVIYIGDYLYSLSPAMLEVHRISDMVMTGELQLE